MNAGGADTGGPNFYALFSGPQSTHNKPMLISETSVGFDTQRTGLSDVDLKASWWSQVYNSRGEFAYNNGDV